MRIGTRGSVAFWLLLMFPKGLLAQEAWTFRGSLDLLPNASFLATSANSLDPDNAQLQLPNLGLGAELRPNLSLAYGETFRLILRPRFWGKVTARWEGANALAYGNELNLVFNDLYGVFAASPKLTVSYGLQSFQWGPAYFANASNRLFHITDLQRTALYVTQGKNLLKVSYSPSANVSLLTLFELADNGEAPFGQGEAFDRKALAKAEYQSDSGDNSVGLVVGVGQVSRPWLGQYFSYSLWDGLSLYADVSESFGTRAYYPVRSPEGLVQMQQTRVTPNHLSVFGVVGSKYALGSSTELAVEYVLNTAGYTQAELADALRGATEPSPYQAGNFAKLLNPGLELRGKNYLYFAARVTDVLPRVDDNLILRYLLSLTDGSGHLYVYYDYALNDALVLFASATVTHGQKDTELRVPLGVSALLGAKCSW